MFDSLQRQCSRGALGAPPALADERRGEGGQDEEEEEAVAVDGQGQPEGSGLREEGSKQERLGEGQNFTASAKSHQPHFPQ